MPGSYLDTTVAIDVAAVKEPSATACMATIAANPPAELPFYALREMLAGYIRNICDAHNVLLAAQNPGEALQALLFLAPFQRRAAQQKLQLIAEALTATFIGNPSGPRNQQKQDMLDSLALEAARVWVRARKSAPWKTVQPLACFNQGEISHGKGGELRGPNNNFNCKKSERCAAAGWLFDNEILLDKLIEALHPNNLDPVASKKTENQSRRRALKDIKKEGPQRFDKGRCRAIGDAYFAAMCPQDASLLSTNVSDFEPLCTALKKKLLKPK